MKAGKQRVVLGPLGVLFIIYLVWSIRHPPEPPLTISVGQTAYVRCSNYAGDEVWKDLENLFLADIKRFASGRHGRNYVPPFTADPDESALVKVAPKTKVRIQQIISSPVIPVSITVPRHLEGKVDVRVPVPFVKVEVVEGPHAGETGWVHACYLWVSTNAPVWEGATFWDSAEFEAWKKTRGSEMGRNAGAIVYLFKRWL
ncbi:MAG: hypothetical protein AAB466_10490 [Verrucomicrobiota bacterium]